MKNGVPFDTAMALSESSGDPENAALGLAIYVILGQFEGGEFSWDTMAWQKKN